MKPDYKTAPKHSGLNVNDFSPGDRVKHWFAGTGTVLEDGNKRTIPVQWDTDGRGGAHPYHLHKIKEDK